jgi:hypothetical protein
MPRLRPSHNEQPRAPHPFGELFARCVSTHTGSAGHFEHSIKVRLDHPAVRANPEQFELAGPIPNWILAELP